MSDRAFVDSNLWIYAFFLRPGEEERPPNRAGLKKQTLSQRQNEACNH